MQLQISKNNTINKFSVESDISSVTAPYLSFNNEYFLNLELSQEANGSNFKINNKYFKVIMAPINTMADHVMGMVLVREGNRTGTWARVDRDFNTIPFDVAHGTWANMKQVMNDTYGELTEIPVTWVKTETLTEGPYAGKNCWWIADGPETGFHVHPAFIGQDGQPHNLQIASWIASKKNDLPFSEDKGNGTNGYWNNITYNDVHAKGWMTGGARPYNVYDHHFLARMMLTEFGTPDVQSQTVDGVAWTGDNRISYHGIHDPFGLPDWTEYFWLDGLTTLNGTYQVLAVDGSGNMVDTGVSCPNTGVWPVNCLVDQANGINFGDLFIANMADSTENSGSFADYQNLHSGNAFLVYWRTGSARGAFYLNRNYPEFESNSLGWRVALCSSETDPIQEEPKKNIKYIQSITKSVDYGTTFENIGLPNAIVATLDDDTTVDLPVTWNSNAYTSTEPGQQNIAGTVTLNDDLTNTNNISVNAVVTVGARPKKNIKSAQSVTKSVDYGTTFNNIGLPNAVTVTLDDDSTATLPVIWNSSSYVGTESGIQYITGTLTLNDDLTNTNNVTAVAAVEVAAQPVASDDWSLQFTLNTVQSEVKLDDIPGFSEKDTPSMEDFYGPDYDNQGRHLEIRYLGTQGHLTYAPDGVPVPNGCSSDDEMAAALNPDGFADYDPDARNIIFDSGSAGTKVYMLVYRSKPFNS